MPNRLLLAACLLALLWGRAKELKHGTAEAALDFSQVVDVFLHGAGVLQE